MRRYLPVPDFIRTNPRYILNVGSLIEGEGRDAALAQNFLEEFKARGLHLGDAGVLLLGSNHASATSDFKYSTVRETLHKSGLSFLSYISKDRRQILTAAIEKSGVQEKIPQGMDMMDVPLSYPITCTELISSRSTRLNANWR